MTRPLHYDAYVFAEVEGIPVDLDRPDLSELEELEDLTAIRAEAAAAGVEVADACSVHRLREPFELTLADTTVCYPEGALVLHDGQEVVYIEHRGSEPCGQRPA